MLQNEPSYPACLLHQQPMGREIHIPYILSPYPCKSLILRKPLRHFLRQRAFQVHCQEEPVPYNRYSRQQPLPCSMSLPGSNKEQRWMEVSKVLLSMQGNKRPLQLP